MTSRRDNVIKALGHERPPSLPRGELFIDRSLLDRFVPDRQGDYAGQLEGVARGFGLDVMGVDLTEEWSDNLLADGAFRPIGDYFTVGYINGPFSRTVRELGFREAILCFRKDPAILLRIASGLMGEAAAKVTQAGQNDFSAFMIADDIAGNRGLLVSADDFSRTLLPVYTELARMIATRGLSAFFHCDGDTRAIIGPLIEAGYRCIHPVDATAGLDLYQLQDTFGEGASFMGHIDLMGWDEGRIAREVDQAERAFAKGGLILGSSGGLSMKTLGAGFSALYPHVGRKKDRT